MEVRMHGIDLRDAPCPVPAGKLLICCSEIMTYNEICQGNFQMVPIETKTFQT